MAADDKIDALFQVPLDEFTAASRLSAQWSFFKELKDLGRACAKRWLAENYQFIGQKSTLDLPEAYS